VRVRTETTLAAASGFSLGVTTAKIVNVWVIALALLASACVLVVVLRDEERAWAGTSSVANVQQLARTGVQRDLVNERSHERNSSSTSVTPGLTSAPQESDGARALELLNENADYDGARALARECLGRDPTDARCNWALLWSFTRQGDWGAELRQASADCLDALPEDAFCIDIAADVAMRDGDLATAERLLDSRASTNADEDRQLIFQQALLAEAKGDRAAACSLFTATCSQGFEPACVRARRVCAQPD
jgi:hypothetical protein